MKKLIFFVILLGFTACHQGANEEESGAEINTAADSSSVFKVYDNMNMLLSYQFELKGKVKDVDKGVLFIEKLTYSNGGIVMFSNLRKEILEDISVRISDDSVSSFKKISFENDFKIKIPVSNFNGFVNDLSSQFIDFETRKLITEDLSLLNLSEELKLTSSKEVWGKIEGSTKVKKANVEDFIKNGSDINDSKLALKIIRDKVDYCVLDLTIFQDNLVTQKTVFLPDTTTLHSPFVYQLKHSFVIGWNFVLEIFYFLLKVWPFILVSFLIFYFRKTKVNLGFLTKSKS